MFIQWCMPFPLLIWKAVTNTSHLTLRRDSLDYLPGLKFLTRGLIMEWQLIVLFLGYQTVLGQGDTRYHRSKRSAENPAFKEIETKKPASFKIGGTDCVFTNTESKCPVTYSSKGTCNLHSVSQQLFPDANLEESTNKFIAPAKFSVERIEVFACKDNAKNGIVSFVGKSSESVELVPQQLTLGAETRLRISWSTLTNFDPEKLEVKLDGFTSIGANERLELNVEKLIGASDYTLHFKTGSLNVNNFLAKFGVDASQMISSELSFAAARIGLATLVIKKPQVVGLFSPGGGYEITVAGKIEAPELPADASEFYIIVQDFKAGSSDPANGNFAKPIAAIFALYKKEKVSNMIRSVSHLNVPEIAVFRGVDEVAIAVASKTIYNINSKTVRNLAQKFVPIEGLDIIPEGFTIMHYAPNSNKDIKDSSNKTADRILFRIEVTKEGLNWTSPQRIETKMEKLAEFIWPLSGCNDKIPIPFQTAVALVGLSYVKEANQMGVTFNLTERVPVLKNGLISLMDSTITLFSEEKKTDTCSWELRGEGKEAFLNELVDVVINQTKVKTTVYANADIFDMETLTNRTKATPLDAKYKAAFPFLTKVPFHNLRYEAVFEKKRVLKFKGYAAVDGKPAIEVLYFLPSGEPQLKVGFVFQNQYLHKVVHMFYGDEKIKSTWMKFGMICISIKNSELEKPIKFDRSCIQEADETFRDPGIGFRAKKLSTETCDGNLWKMCQFLRMHFGDVVDITYVGRMLPENIRMISHDRLTFKLGKGLRFEKDNVISKIDSTDTGDRLSFNADVFLNDNEGPFPGKIFDDGTNKILLHFGTNEGNSSSGEDLLGVAYAQMDPIRSQFAIPTDDFVDVIEFQSRLHIGSIPDNRLEFSGHSARQYISYVNDTRTVKFVGEKKKLKISNLYKAFAIPDRHRFLRKATFDGQVIVAYTSENEVWEVKEFDVKVKKGLHFYGKLSLKTGETYDAKINILENMQLQTVINLKPLRYGKMANDSQGKPTFEKVNLALHRDSKRPELGPNLVLEGEIQKLTGYAETVGMEGSFVTEMKHKSKDDSEYQIKLKGDLYKEVENAEILLTTVAEDRPKDFEFKYQVDITKQGQRNIDKSLREALEDIKNNAKKGKDAADNNVNDAKTLLESHKERYQGHVEEMSSVEDQIHNINSDFDLALIDVSTDCIDQCKTVFIPGVEWKEDCISGSGGQRNMKCMSWKENKEKVVNVVCALKCEAKKTVAAGKAAENLEKIKVLVNRYREQKILAQDVGKLIELAEQAHEIAKSAKELVDSKTEAHDELEKLLTLSGDVVELNALKVNTQLNDISPPCLPFQIDFTIKTEEPSSHNGVYPICFNGEFYKSLGVRLMRIKYPAIDEMYKALEEAELRYARIRAIEKSLGRVENDIRKASKRGSIPSLPMKDPDDVLLTKISKRRIPAFTLKGDKTTLAFQHYSPWATIKRNDPFEMEPKSPYHEVKYNISNFQRKSACHQTREIIAEYNDITENLHQLSTNYKHGKHIYGKTKNSVIKELQSSQSEIMELMRGMKLLPVEKRDMLYWYKFTRKGMSEYFSTFENHLAEQNKRSLTHLKRGLSSFYGTGDFLSHLGNLGSDAARRSTVNGRKRSKQILGITEVGNELQRVLSMNLDDAEPFIANLKGEIQVLRTSTALC